MKILEVRPEQVICLDNGQITTRPNSPYYSLKYFKYNNKRIGYTFSDRSYTMETFDARIFNCWHEGKRIQLRQDLSERLAAAINHHDMYGNIREYAELFKVAFNEIPNWIILDMYLKNINGVEQTKNGFIIYDDFRIDFHGNAWIKNQSSDRPLGEDEGVWRSLCIVMQGTSHAYKMDKGGFLPDHHGNMIEVSALTMTIISKIVFLLNPNLKDRSFTAQLSKNLLTKLEQLGGKVK